MFSRSTGTMLTNLDTIYAENPVKVTFGRRELPWDNISNREVQNWLSAITLFYAWKDRYCCEVGDAKLRGSVIKLRVRKSY